MLPWLILLCCLQAGVLKVGATCDDDTNIGKQCVSLVLCIAILIFCSILWWLFITGMAKK